MTEIRNYWNSRTRYKRPTSPHAPHPDSVTAPPRPRAQVSSADHAPGQNAINQAEDLKIRSDGSNAYGGFSDRGDYYMNEALTTGDTRYLTMAQKQQMWDMYNMGDQTSDDDGGGGRRRSYGGGGGGGYGADALAAANAQSGSLRQLLASNMFQAGSIDPQMGKLNSAYNDDMAAMTSAYDRSLGAIGDKSAWDDLQIADAGRAEVDPALLEWISQNGSGSQAYQAELANTNNERQSSKSAAERFRQQMAAAASQSRDSRRAENSQAREFAGSEMGAAKNAIEARLLEQQKAEQQAKDAQRMQIMMQLISTMSAVGQQADLTPFLGGQ